MRKRLLMLLSVFMMVTSVGWLHAQETTGTISSELLKAQTDREVVFGITTKQGNVPANTMVRVALTAKDKAFDGWKSYYYEPNGDKPDWIEWNPENDGFGPAGGFPFQDATSYIKVTPKKAGTYEYTLTVTAVQSNAVLLKKIQTLVVTDAPTTPMAKIETTDYASLGTAVHFAKEGQTIKLTTGNFNLVPGTEKIAVGNNAPGWYLPITQKNLTIEGVKGEGENATFVQSDVKTENGVWSSQNLITVFADGVTLKNMIIDCKKEVNKAIEVVAKDFKMSNVQVGIFGENASGFGGSVYFNGTDIGTVTIENSQLIKSRITFTGSQMGNVILNNVNINYENVVVEGANMAELQQYGPFGATAGKANLKITATDLNVFMSAAENTYKLDANTIANLPAGTMLRLNAGEYKLSSRLIIDKPISIVGTVASGIPTTVFTATGDNWITTGGKGNLISIEGNATGKASISGVKVTGSKASGINAQSSMNTELSQVLLEGNTNAGMLVHSKVTATGLKTKDNGWGGVNIDKGSPVFESSFSFDATSSFAEPLQIWSELADAVVTLPANATDWRKYTSGKFQVWTNASLSVTAKDAAELLAAIKSAQPGQVITLTGNTYELDNNLTISQPSTLKNGGTAKITFKNGGLVVAANNVVLEKLDIKATIGNALVVNENITGTQVKGGFYANDVVGKQGEGAMRFNGANGAIVVTDATLKGGLHVLKYDGGDLAGIKGNTIAIENTKTPLVGINVHAAADKTPKLTAIALLKQQKSVTMPASGAQYDVLYQNNNWSVTDGVASPESAIALDALFAADGKANLTISLAAKEYAFSKKLNINKTVKIVGTIAGTDTTSIVAKDWANSAKYDSTLINIEKANNVSLSNLNIKNAQRNGLTAYVVTGVTLDNVKIMNSKAAGMVVDGSEVKITNFRTSGSGWGYGVNVDKGSGVEATPLLTIGEGCVFGEAIAVKSDKSDAPSSYVIGSGWVQLKKGTEGNEYMVWANAASSGINISITSIPAKVTYGQAILPLIANVEDATIAITKGTTENVVELKQTSDQPDSLIIKKPGEAVLTITANDMVVTQTLTVLKKTLAVAGITATTKSYDGKTDVTLVTTGMTVKGLVGTDKQDDILNTPTGVLTSANAGDAVPVEVTATFKSGKADYYDLAPITGVTDTVKKVALTVKVNKPDSVEYAKVDPSKFAATVEGFVNSETAANLTGKLQFDCPATNSSLAGKYAVMPYGYTSQNYAITYTADSLEITAIAPTVELVSATIGADKTSATVKGRVTSNGGTKTTDLKGDFKVGDAAKNLNLVVGKDGNFSTTLTGLASQEQSICAVAGKGKLSDTSAAMSVNLSLNLQNVAFVSELSRLVYGSEATLGAKDFVKGAKVTFTSSDASVLSIEDSIQVKAKKAGTATITVTATLDGYITAVAKQTVTVEPKALTVAVAGLDKTYDGTTAVAPTYTLNGVVEADKKNVSVSAVNVAANYLDKNASEASKTVVLSGALTLSGTAAGNYSLTQPANLKGIISQAGKVTIGVANATRKYNETALRYDLTATGLVGDETLTTPNLYTGVISVSENGENAVVSLKDVSFANYLSVKAENGTVNVVKGTPRVLTLSGKTEADDVTGLILDTEGWDITADDLKIMKNEDAGKTSSAETYYAQVTYGDGQIARGASIEKKAAPVIEATAWDWKEVATKALTLRATETGKELTYGNASTFAKMEGFTFETANPAVITLSDADNNAKQVNAVGVGTAAILATKDGGVTYLEVTVTPAQLAATASDLQKVYDGSNLANPQIVLTQENSDGVYIDLKDVQFTYASKNVGTDVVINPSKPLVLTGEKAANYTINVPKLKGAIKQRNLTVNGPISKYYDGTAKETLTSYSAEGLISGEEVPVTATFTDATAGTDKTVTLTTTSNYNIADASVKTGSIVKSTIDVTLNAETSSAAASAVIKDLTVRETGEKVTVAAIGLTPVIVTEGSGANTVYYVSGGDTDNYTVVYASNQIGFKAEEGGDDDVTGITLDKTELTLQPQGTYALKATLAPSTVTGKTISWTSSNDQIATVNADGNVTAVAIGEATITASVDGKSATCKVTVTAATALEEAIANTRVYGKDGSIRIEPQMPMDVMVVNLVGQPIYKGHIDGASQIAVSVSGIYIVKLGTGSEAKVHKVSVK